MSSMNFVFSFGASGKLSADPINIKVTFFTFSFILSQLSSPTLREGEGEGEGEERAVVGDLKARGYQ